MWTCTIHASAKSKGRMRYLRLLRREAHRRHLLMWHHTLLRWHAAHRPRGMLRGPKRGPAGTWGGSKPRPRLLHRHSSRPWRSRALHKQHSASTQGCVHSGAGMCLLSTVALHAQHMLQVSLILEGKAVTARFDFPEQSEVYQLLGTGHKLQCQNFWPLHQTAVLLAVVRHSGLSTIL